MPSSVAVSASGRPLLSSCSTKPDELAPAASALMQAASSCSAEVRVAIEEAQNSAAVAEDQAQDEARANALNNLVLGVRATLAEAAPDALTPPVDEPPADQPPAT